MNLYNNFNTEGLSSRPKVRQIFLIILLCFSFDAAAQDRDTIMDGDMEFSYFGGMTLKFNSIVGDLSGLIGGQGGVLINDAIYLGIALGTTITEIGGGYDNYTYKGLLLGSFVKPSEAIHYFADVGLYSGEMSSGGNRFVPFSREKFSIIEPNIGVGVNLNDKLKTTLGLSYKLVSAIDDENISKKDVGGFSLNGAIIFGF